MSGDERDAAVRPTIAAMRHPLTIPLLAVAALLLWAWSVYGFVAGVLNDYGDPSAGTAGRFGAAAGVIMTALLALTATIYLVKAVRLRRRG